MKINKIVVIALILSTFSCTQESPESSQEKEEKNYVKLEEDENVDAESEEIIVPESFERGKENPVSDLGIGLIIAPEKMTLYNDSLLEDPYMDLDWSENKNIPDDIKPMFFDPESGVMHFVCLKLNKRYLKVLVNFDEYKYFSREKKYKIKKWSSYIFQSFGVKRKTDNDGTPLHQNNFVKNNLTNGEVIDIPEGNELFCPVKISGDWLKVKYDCNSVSYENEHSSSPCFNYIDECEPLQQGWIKWREKNLLLLEIHNNF